MGINVASVAILPGMDNPDTESLGDRFRCQWAEELRQMASPQGAEELEENLRIAVHTARIWADASPKARLKAEADRLVAELYRVFAELVVLEETEARYAETLRWMDEPPDVEFNEALIRGANDEGIPF